MAKKRKIETRVVRIDEPVVRAVENHIKEKKGSIGGFFAYSALKQIEKEKKSNNVTN